MAKHEAHHTCDLCGGSFPTAAYLRGNLSFYTPDGSLILGELCNGCSDTLREDFLGAYKDAAWMKHFHESSVAPAE